MVINDSIDGTKSITIKPFLSVTVDTLAGLIIAYIVSSCIDGSITSCFARGLLLGCPLARDVARGIELQR
jgi:hypothetical protein